MSSEINNLLTEKILNSHFFVELLSSKEDIANKSIQSKISTLEFLVEVSTLVKHIAHIFYIRSIPLFYA